jgi:hypothetical protein
MARFLQTIAPRVLLAVTLVAAIAIAATAVAGTGFS